MADIFIFYASPDRPAAEALAKDLTARGYSVWRELPPAGGGEAQTLIRSELNEAKVILVIWSENAVKSEWVCGGAAGARETSRLVQVIVDGFPARHIPLPFHVFDLTLVSDSDGIVRNLEKLSRIRKEAPAWPETERAREIADDAPPLSTPPLSSPPLSAPPMSVPPMSVPPGAVPPMSVPPGAVPPAAAPAPSAQPEAAPAEAAPEFAYSPPPPPQPQSSQPASAADAPEPKTAAARSPAAKRKQRSAATVENVPVSGKLVENIPRRMRVAEHERVEVRLSREETAELLTAFEGGGAPQSHDIQVTQAMSVMLRARTGTFHIQNLSPETQWVYERPGVIGPKFGRWRWDVTPLKRGDHKLLLIVSARTARGDGIAGDVALPDQVVEVAVRANVRRELERLGLWAGIAVAGGVLTEGVLLLVRAVAG